LYGLRVFFPPIGKIIKRKNKDIYSYAKKYYGVAIAMGNGVRKIQYPIHNPFYGEDEYCV
jgi:hypothetical protein